MSGDTFVNKLILLTSVFLKKTDVNVTILTSVIKKSMLTKSIYLQKMSPFIR